MKKIVLGLVIAVAGAATLAPDVADARRLGGGGSIGMKRQATPPPQQQPPAQQAQQPPAQQAAPPQQAAPAAAAAAKPGTAAAAAAAPKRSWLGPIAGLAAGLGIAALLSHFGLGAAFAEFLTLLLLAIVAIVAVRWLLRRFAPAPTGAASQRVQFAGAQGATDASPRFEPTPGAGASASVAPPVAAALPAGLPPPDFDRAAFERVAKLVFIRMQAANDAGDVQDLRRFTTPQMYAEIQLELQERSGRAQRTDVVQLDAQVLDSAEEDGQQVVSVRFHGLTREEQDGPATPFDEVWHFVRPLDGSREWAIAGIAQSA